MDSYLPASVLSCHKESLTCFTLENALVCALYDPAIVSIANTILTLNL